MTSPSRTIASQESLYFHAMESPDDDLNHTKSHNAQVTLDMNSNCIKPPIQVNGSNNNDINSQPDSSERVNCSSFNSNQEDHMNSSITCESMCQLITINIAWVVAV